MKVSVLCSSLDHPVNAYLEQWAKDKAPMHEVTIVRAARELGCGDILFLVSCSEILGERERQAFGATLVLHASDLPEGRGWSPHIWQLVNGADHIVVCLIEAAEPVDTGSIWKRLRVPVPHHALWDEINQLLFSAELELMDFALARHGSVEPVAQAVDLHYGSFRRRTPEDSRLDPKLSIAEQFDLIRVCDPVRFPAFFELHGYRYRLRLDKIDER